LKGQTGGHKETDTDGDEALVDLEEQAYDQMRLLIAYSGEIGHPFRDDTGHLIGA